MALGLPRLSRRWAERNLIEGAWHHDTARDVDWAIGAALLIRRRALDEIGGLDERYFMYAEDLEWCWRARSAGWTVRFEPASRFVHVGNASGRQRYAGRRTAAHLTNSYRFFRQAHGRAALWGYRTANVAGTLRQLLVGIVRRDRDAIRYWKTVMVAHLTPTPDDDPGRFIADPS
jgi:GT2 family glycosyltransferase